MLRRATAWAVPARRAEPARAARAFMDVLRAASWTWRPLMQRSSTRRVPAAACLLLGCAWGGRVAAAPGDGGGLPGLLAHVYLGRAQVVAELLDRGADVDARDADGWCALLLAAAEGHAAMVELILANGADATVRLDGDTPLMLAATRGHTAVVAQLLKHGGAQVNACRAASGETALMLAAANGHDDACVELLRFGADLEARDAKGNTPLALAARYSHRTTVALLLQHGAELEAGHEYYGMRWGNVGHGKKVEKPPEQRVDLDKVVTVTAPWSGK